MAFYSAQIKYKYGSGRATTSASVGTSQLKGKSETAVLAFLYEKHKTIKNLEIILENINWRG